MKRNIKLVIEYDGTSWHGWQLQKNAPSIQGAMEEALHKIFSEAPRLTGASRTDAGVHALGQVANFYTKASIPLGRIPYALNSVLPPSIVVREAGEMNQDFHARFSATGKRYTYRILNSPVPRAIGRHYAYQVRAPLCLPSMATAAQIFVGEHDFASFQAAGRPVKSTVRRLQRLDVERISADAILFTVEGDGFLYKMVRNLVGTLLEVGTGKRQPEEMLPLLAAADRSLAGSTAPPQGLCLEEVFYGS